MRALGIGHAMTYAVSAGGATLIGRNAIDPARWKRYRGGTAGQLWVDAHNTGSFSRLGRDIAGNLVWPMWLDGRIFFLSDHEGIGNIYSCAPDGADLRRHTDERAYYARFPSTDGTRIVYACGAQIVVLDPRDGSVRRIDLQTPSTAAQSARRFVDAGELLETFSPSPDGTALGLISRGRAFAMPLWEEAVSEHGTGPERRREIVWLHDGTRIAYVDDSAGYERILVEPVDQSAGATAVTSDDIGRMPRGVLEPAVEYTLFTLPVGAVSDPLETPRGYWIAKRTE